MRLHGSARTCPKSRRLIADRVLVDGWTLTAAASAAGVSVVTARKWVRRAAAGESLRCRSTRPKRVPHRTPAGRVEAIRALRRLRMTAAEIAELLGMALSTVSRWLKRIGLGKRSRLEPAEPPNRYERRRPGELVHVDIKKLGRIGRPGHRATGSRASRGYHRKRFEQGWEFVHVCIDDHSRLAYVEVLSDELGPTAAGFLARAVAWFKGHGIQVERVMTDNGACYRSKAHAASCHQLGLKHLRTQPYRPRTNGKAERFIRTMLDEWAYGRIYASSTERTARLAPWLTHYNYRRPHSALGHQPPTARLNEQARNYT
jgi:transposase InsO family protein